VGRQIVAQTALRAAAGIERLFAQHLQVAGEAVDLLLLAVQGLVDRVEQVVGEAGFDLQVGQSEVGVFCSVHGAIGHHIGPVMAGQRVGRGLRQQAAGIKVRSP
jgi:hypothetical protein